MMPWINQAKIIQIVIKGENMSGLPVNFEALFRREKPVSFAVFPEF